MADNSQHLVSSITKFVSIVEKNVLVLTIYKYYLLYQVQERLWKIIKKKKEDEIYLFMMSWILVWDEKRDLNCINVMSSEVSTRGWFALLKRRLQLVYEHPCIKRGREQRWRGRKISIASTNREINNAGLSRIHRAVDRFSINLKKIFVSVKKKFAFPVLSGYRRKSAGEKVAMKICVRRYRRLFLFRSFH